MNSRVLVALVVTLALIAAGYLWYENRSAPLPPQVTERDTEALPSAPQIANGIEGSWQSTDDPKFTRSFTNGQVTDRYEGNADATVTGHYELNGDHVPGQVRELAAGKPVLSIEYPEEVLFFFVTKLTATELELVYVGVGQTLRFTRI